MRILLISDIHGNWQALRSIRKEFSLDGLASLEQANFVECRTSKLPE